MDDMADNNNFSLGLTQRKKFDEEKLEKRLQSYLSFTNEMNSISSNDSTFLTAQQLKLSFKYDIKRISEPDNYRSFTTGALHQFVVLRKIFLKLAELSETLGSTNYSNDNISYSSKLSNNTPTIQSWSIVLVKFLKDIQSLSLITSEQKKKDLLKGINRKLKHELSQIQHYVHLLQQYFQIFSKELSEFVKYFGKVAHKICKCLSSTASPSIEKKFRESFMQIQDIEIAKTTNILSPVDSKDINELEKVFNDEEHQFLIYDEVKKSIHLKKQQKVGQNTESSLADLSQEERFRILRKFCYHFCLYLNDMIYLTLECSSSFTIKSKKKNNIKPKSYLQMRLERVEESIKRLQKCYPMEQTRCLELIWQTDHLLQNIQLITEPLEKFITSIVTIWTDIFEKEDFSVEEFNFRRAENSLNEWQLFKEKSAAFDLTYRPQRDYWCPYIIAPANNEIANPLVFQLVENELTGIIDFSTEYYFRLNRMYSCELVFVDDVEISSAQIQQLFYTSTILAKQFHHLYQELRKPLEFKFGRIVDENILFQASQQNMVQNLLLFNSSNAEDTLSYWILIIAQCYKLTCPGHVLFSKLKQLESCFELLKIFVKKLQKVYKKIQRKHQTLSQILKVFEKLKLGSEELTQIQDFKLCEIQASFELPVFQPSSSSSEKQKPFKENYLPNIDEMILIKICPFDLKFILSDGNQFSYNEMNSESRANLFESFLKTTIKLISTRINFLEKNERFLFKNRNNFNNNPESFYYGKLIKELQQLVQKCRNVNDLEILIALRTLRYVKHEMEYLRSAVYHTMTNCQIGKQNFEWFIQVFQQNKFVAFDNFASGYTKTLCVFDKSIKSELQISGGNYICGIDENDEEYIGW